MKKVKIEGETSKQKRTWFQPPLEFGEVNNQPSLTVPDQSMSVSEIMTRYAKGLPLEGQRTPIFDDTENGGEEYFPDPSKMDLADREAMANHAKEQLKIFEDKKAARLAARRRAADEKKKHQQKFEGIQEAEVVPDDKSDKK